MKTFVIYTTARCSYIVPKELLKLPKQYSNCYEIDSPVEICSKRCKLAARVTSMDAVSGVLKRLVEYTRKDEGKLV